LVVDDERMRVAPIGPEISVVERKAAMAVLEDEGTVLR